jgi:hypothetical protein
MVEVNVKQTGTIFPELLDQHLPGWTRVSIPKNLLPPRPIPVQTVETSPAYEHAAKPTLAQTSSISASAATC